MCRYRRVCNIYLRCGHRIQEPDELIECGSKTCRFSQYHFADCRPPHCRATCVQYRSYPEQYSPNRDRFCPHCEAAGFS